MARKSKYSRSSSAARPRGAHSSAAASAASASAASASAASSPRLCPERAEAKKLPGPPAVPAAEVLNFVLGTTRNGTPQDQYVVVAVVPGVADAPPRPFVISSAPDERRPNEPTAAPTSSTNAAGVTLAVLRLILLKKLPGEIPSGLRLAGLPLRAGHFLMFSPGDDGGSLFTAYHDYVPRLDLPVPRLTPATVPADAPYLAVLARTVARISSRFPPPRRTVAVPGTMLTLAATFAATAEDVDVLSDCWEPGDSCSPAFVDNIVRSWVP